MLTSSDLSRTRHPNRKPKQPRGRIGGQTKKTPFDAEKKKNMRWKGLGSKGDDDDQWAGDAFQYLPCIID